MNDLIDDQEIQRLLDGTLTSDDRALLLQYAEDHPANWRRISLAFLEEQVLRNEMSRLIDHPMPSQPTASTDNFLPTEDVRGRSMGRPFHLFCHAAALCLLFGTAVWIGRVTVEQESQLVADEVVDGAMRPETADDYTIVLTPDQQTDPIENNAVQLASTNSNSDDVVDQMFAPIFDRESQGVFRDYGYTVNEEPVIFVVQGPTGEQYLVPRRNVSFVADTQ